MSEIEGEREGGAEVPDLMALANFSAVVAFWSFRTTRMSFFPSSAKRKALEPGSMVMVLVDLVGRAESGGGDMGAIFFWLLVVWRCGLPLAAGFCRGMSCRDPLGLRFVWCCGCRSRRALQLLCVWCGGVGRRTNVFIVALERTNHFPSSAFTRRLGNQLV